MKFKFDSIQQLGRALMLPIALLPIAGLLLRFGQPDLLNVKYIADAGNVIFSQLPILFALGVAVGVAKDNNGTAALASAVGYFIMTSILTEIDKTINTGVLGGIIIGLVAASLYNRFKDIRLPEFLAFFGGKRFVPIITGLTAVVLGIVLGYTWPPIQNGINVFGNWLLKSGGIGLFIYGFLNRIFLIAGLHHVLNNLVWFVFGSYTEANGVVVHGDIARFMADDQTAGTFMAGWFPIMMFGLPAACLAMFKNALPQNKKAVGGLLLSMAITSFLTGVTEPIEYSFIFLAPVLFVVHSVLSGLALVTMNFFSVHLGFTFSAGLIDYVLFFKKGTHPIYLIPIGLVFFALYYFLFDFFIRKYNLLTPGRETDGMQVDVVRPDSRALQFIDALGGTNNLLSVDACTTRLRLVVEDSAKIDKMALKGLGAKGILAPTKESVQVILGPLADLISSEIRDALKIMPNINQEVKSLDKVNESMVSSELDNEKFVQISAKIIEYFGGKDNIDSFNLTAISRIRFVLKNELIINTQLLSKPDIVKIIDAGTNIKYVYLGDNAKLVFNIINKLLS